MLELVLDPNLQPLLQFDAVQKFCRLDNEWVRFIDEPWSADNWANTQVGSGL